MNPVQPQPTATPNRKQHSLTIDMTPLVDLGFLLISFFIFTAALTTPAVTRLIMPKDGKESAVPQSHALTFLLDRNKLFAYEGLWEEAKARKRIVETSYGLQNGAGKLVRQKQRSSGEKLVVLIKPLTTSSYEDMVTMLDEMQINGVMKFAIVEASDEEQSWTHTRSGYPH
ncbi:MAG: biopolymer transporter ExbD [Bacteroidota bacterium]|nr:biopolymer transporter ExbD [Bacteroidota bacterium]